MRQNGRRMKNCARQRDAQGRRRPRPQERLMIFTRTDTLGSPLLSIFEQFSGRRANKLHYTIIVVGEHALAPKRGARRARAAPAPYLGA